MPEPLAGGDMSGEQRMEAALKPFGWQCGPDFWKRYYSDPWVFSLANAVERLSEQLDRLSLAYIEATNPGIDMDDVRRTRATSQSTVHVPPDALAPITLRPRPTHAQQQEGTP